MSSRARFSAVLASVWELAPGFEARIALLRSIALSIDGAAQDLTSPSGFRAGYIPFEAVEFEIEIVANVKGGDAIVQGLESGAGILQAGARRQHGLQLQR